MICSECEEFAYDIEVSDHCYRCRQDTLCKRLLVQRGKEFLRSRSSSPTSDYSSSSDEEFLPTPVDVIAPSLLSEKLVSFRVEVVDADENQDVAPDSAPTASSRVSPSLVPMDL